MKVSRKVRCCIGILVLCIIGVFSGSTFISMAESEENVNGRWYAYVNGEIPDVTIREGEIQEITLPVTANCALTVEKIKVSMQDAPFSLRGTPKLYREGANEEVHSIGTGNYFIKFSLCGRKSTLNKTYSIVICLLLGNRLDNLEQIELLDSVPVTYKAEKEDTSKGNVEIANIKCVKELKLGEKTDISFSLKNTGDGRAYDITVTYCGFEDAGMVPGKSSTTKKIDHMDSNETKDFIYPVQVAKNAYAGAKKLGLMVSYKKRKTDIEYKTESENFFIEVIVIKKVKIEKIKTPKIKIKSVKQSVEQPEAGTDIAVSFIVQNVGEEKAEMISITPKDLTNRTFSPLDDEISVSIDKLAPKEQKVVTLHYQISDRIESGLSYIDYTITLKNKKGAELSSGARVYIKNIQVKQQKDTGGVPKLIIEKYNTGVNKVKAGDEFLLKLDIKNTHKKIRAKNIRVSIVTEEDGVFSIAEGKHSFYITSIGANKKSHIEVPMKVKSDCLAKSYPLRIAFEYEYKASPYVSGTDSYSLNEILSIKVEEDSRPSITKIVPGTYGDLICGEYNGLTFEFNNRGKSALYNVQVKIGGDFHPTQKTYYIGTVPEGARSSHEIEITPTVKGAATGTMLVTYEENDGEKNTIEYKFSANVISSEAGLADEQKQPGTGDNKTSKIVLIKRMLKAVAFLMFEFVLFLVSVAVAYRITYLKFKNKKENAN